MKKPKIQVITLKLTKEQIEQLAPFKKKIRSHPRQYAVLAQPFIDHLVYQGKMPCALIDLKPYCEITDVLKKHYAVDKRKSE